MEKANLLQYTFLTGFILGGFTASQRASLQFLAEHQHERLSKRSEFVAFHRARNYRLMAAFGTGGVRRGVQLVAVAAAYLTAKDGIAFLRQNLEFSFRIPRFLDNVAVCSLLGASAFAIGSKESTMNHVLLIFLDNSPKFYHFKRGAVLGSLLGLTLSTVEVIKNKIEI